MNLVYDLLNEPYRLEYGNFYNITIENMVEFRKVIDHINSNDYIKIYIDEIVVNNFKIVESSLFFDFEDKKILNKVIKDLELLSKDEFFLDDYYNSCIDLRSFISKIIFDYDIPLEINDSFDMGYVLKAFGLRLKIEDSSFFERIINFLKIYMEVFKINIFIFVNLTQFLTDDELIQLLDFLKKNQILLLNYDKIYMNSKIIKHQLLFDEDLCRIL